MGLITESTNGLCIIRAETKFRRDEWEKYKKQPEYAEKVKEYETKNAARGKKPAQPRSINHHRAYNDTIIIPPSEEVLDSAIAELEALIESDDIRGPVERPPRRLDPIPALEEPESPIPALEKAKAPITAFEEADENGDGVIDELEFEKVQVEQHRKWCLKQFEGKDLTSSSNNCKYYMMHIVHPDEFGPTETQKLTMKRWTELKEEVGFGKIEYEKSPWFQALENDSKK